jgi:hypothetical protein
MFNSFKLYLYIKKIKKDYQVYCYWVCTWYLEIAYVYLVFPCLIVWITSLLGSGGEGEGSLWVALTSNQIFLSVSMQ